MHPYPPLAACLAQQSLGLLGHHRGRSGGSKPRAASSAITAPRSCCSLHHRYDSSAFKHPDSVSGGCAPAQRALSIEASAPKPNFDMDDPTFDAQEDPDIWGQRAVIPPPVSEPLEVMQCSGTTHQQNPAPSFGGPMGACRLLHLRRSPSRPRSACRDALPSPGAAVPVLCIVGARRY